MASGTAKRPTRNISSTLGCPVLARFWLRRGISHYGRQRVFRLQRTTRDASKLPRQEQVFKTGNSRLENLGTWPGAPGSRRFLALTWESSDDVDRGHQLSPNPQQSSPALRNEGFRLNPDPRDLCKSAVAFDFLARRASNSKLETGNSKLLLVHVPS